VSFCHHLSIKTDAKWWQKLRLPLARWAKKCISVLSKKRTRSLFGIVVFVLEKALQCEHFMDKWWQKLTWLIFKGIGNNLIHGMNYTGFLLCYTFYGFPAMLYRNTLSQMNWNLVWSIYRRSSLKNAHFVPIH
jgi:hypothetical protein